MDFDLNKSPPASPAEAAPCSICLDPVEHASVRSVALLQCGHTFHLDCIGSAFNVKGMMQCPNCRNIEGGHWQFANGVEPSTDSSPNFGSGVVRYEHLSNFIYPSNGSTLLNYEPTPQSWSSSVATLGSSSADASRARRHGIMRGQIQQAGPSATRSSPYPPTTRRIQPRVLSIVSSITTSQTVENTQARAANVENSDIPNQNNASRRVDHMFGWDTQWTFQ